VLYLWNGRDHYTVWAMKEPAHSTSPSHNVFLFFKHNAWVSLFSLLSFGLKCFASSSSYSRTLYHQDLFKISPIPRGLLCLHQLREISLVTLRTVNLISIAPHLLDVSGLKPEKMLVFFLNSSSAPVQISDSERWILPTSLVSAQTKKLVIDGPVECD